MRVLSAKCGACSSRTNGLSLVDIIGERSDALCGPICNHVVDRCCCQPSLHGWFVRDESVAMGIGVLARKATAGRFTSLLLLGPSVRVAARPSALHCARRSSRAPTARSGGFCCLPYWKRDRCAHRFARLHAWRSPAAWMRSGESSMPARTPPWAWPPRRGPSSWRPASPPAPQPTLVVVAGEDAAVAFARNVAAYVGEERVLRFPERADVPLRPEAGRPSRHRPAHGGRLGAQERPRSRGGGERPGAAAPVAAGGGERRAADRACGRRGA